MDLIYHACTTNHELNLSRTLESDDLSGPLGVEGGKARRCSYQLCNSIMPVVFDVESSCCGVHSC